MSCRARASLRLCPASIPVHDDSDMARHTCAVKHEVRRIRPLREYRRVLPAAKYLSPHRYPFRPPLHRHRSDIRPKHPSGVCRKGSRPLSRKVLFICGDRRTAHRRGYERNRAFSAVLAHSDNIEFCFVNGKEIAWRMRLLRRIRDPFRFKRVPGSIPRICQKEFRRQISMTSFSFDARISSICFTNLSTSFCTES